MNDYQHFPEHTPKPTDWRCNIGIHKYAKVGEDVTDMDWLCVRCGRKEGIDFTDYAIIAVSIVILALTVYGFVKLLVWWLS